MENIMQPVSVICWFNELGEVAPIKLKLVDEVGNDIIIKIDRVVDKKIERYIGNIKVCFVCRVTLSEATHLLEIKFEKDTGKWILSRGTFKL